MIGRVTSLIKMQESACDELLFASGSTVPTAATAGYETGCIFQHTDGGVGTAFYINEGTAASCDFQAVAALTAAQEASLTANTALLAATAGTATASKAVILDADKHVDEVNTAKLSIGATGAEVEVTATPAHINLYTARINSLIAYLADGLLVAGDLAVDGVNAEKFGVDAISAYTIGGLGYTKAITDQLQFTLADTINVTPDVGDFYGIWLVQINAAGTISTKAGGGTADQAYISEAAAIADLPDPDTDNIALGYILIGANSDSAWTANTDDMTALSDCASVSFVDATLKTLPAALA